MSKLEKVFFKVIPTHYRQADYASCHTEPMGTADEWISKVSIYAAKSWRFAPPEHSDRWFFRASLTRYTKDGEWFLGAEAWHPNVPTAYTLFRDGVDKRSLTDMLDAFKLAYRLTEEQRAETGDCYLYHKAKQRILQHFGEAA